MPLSQSLLVGTAATIAEGPRRRAARAAAGADAKASATPSAATSRAEGTVHEGGEGSSRPSCSSPSAAAAVAGAAAGGSGGGGGGEARGREGSAEAPLPLLPPLRLLLLSPSSTSPPRCFRISFLRSNSSSASCSLRWRGSVEGDDGRGGEQEEEGEEEAGEGLSTRSLLVLRASATVETKRNASAAAPRAQPSTPPAGLQGFLVEGAARKTDLTPLEASLSPTPSCSPATTLRGTARFTKSTSLVSPKKRTTALTNMPAAVTSCSVIGGLLEDDDAEAADATATAAIVFIGCTGMGTPKAKPEMIL